MQLDEPSGWTLQNMLTTAYLVVRGALRREESRGVHFRNDFPEARPEWQRHQEVSRNGASGAGAAGAADGAAPGGGPDEVPHACPGG
jgi:succinate dehydrogenase/fumarate reductase flavoprotein subunit